MAQTGSLGWAQGWGVVRQVLEKLEFIAFFDTAEDAEAAASEVGPTVRCAGYSSKTA